MFFSKHTFYNVTDVNCPSATGFPISFGDLESGKKWKKATIKLSNSVHVSNFEEKNTPFRINVCLNKGKLVLNSTG